MTPTLVQSPNPTNRLTESLTILVPEPRLHRSHTSAPNLNSVIVGTILNDSKRCCNFLRYSSLVNLMYSEITIATGQLKKYYQPRKSSRTVAATLHGDKVPLHGAGASLAVSNDGGGIPMKLILEVWSKGNMVGKLVKSRHRRRISCSLGNLLPQ